MAILTFEKYCTTLLKMMASSGEGTALYNLDNMILAFHDVHSSYLILKKYSVRSHFLHGGAILFEGKFTSIYGLIYSRPC